MSAAKLLEAFSAASVEDIEKEIASMEQRRDEQIAHANNLIEVARRLLKWKRALAGQAPEVVLTNVQESAAAPSRSMEKRNAAQEKPMPTLSPLPDRIATFLDYGGPSNVGVIAANILVDRDVVAKALKNNSRFVRDKDGLWDLGWKIEAKQGE